MSQVAGRMATLVGAQYLLKPSGGRGLLMSGVPGVHAARVGILGAGVSGMHAAEIALGMRADVTIFDISAERLAAADAAFGGTVWWGVFSSRKAITDYLPSADLILGCVLVAGGGAQADQARRFEVDEARQCAGGCGDRPGRLFRDFASHHP